MKIFPKINSIHFGGTWIALSLLVGVLCPLLIWIFTGKYLRLFSIIGGISLLIFVIVFAIEMHQDFGKKPYYLSKLSEDVPFDKDSQTAVIKCSICTGEQVAGFKNNSDGHFTEVMVIRSEKDIELFRKIYQIEKITKEY